MKSSRRMWVGGGLFLLALVLVAVLLSSTIAFTVDELKDIVLVETFGYPRLGAGQMYEPIATSARRHHRVVTLRWSLDKHFEALAHAGPIARERDLVLQRDEAVETLGDDLGGDAAVHIAIGAPGARYECLTPVGHRTGDPFRVRADDAPRRRHPAGTPARQPGGTRRRNISADP